MMSEDHSVNLENAAETNQNLENEKASKALTIKVYERKFLPANRPIADNNIEDIDSLIGYLD